MNHPATDSDDQLKAACQSHFQRRSGPGGQHRNKVETGVVLTHKASGVESAAYERRSQADNLKVALRRMRLNLALQIRTTRDSPSDLWRERCRNQRISINPNHADFPALLAECLDFLAAEDWDPRATANRLNCTPSQLIRLIKREPRAIQLLNDEREARDLGRLK